MSWRHIKTNNTGKCTTDESTDQKERTAELFELLYNPVYKGCYMLLNVPNMAFLFITFLGGTLAD